MKMTKQQIFQKAKPELIEVEDLRKGLVKSRDRKSTMQAIIGVGLLLVTALLSKIFGELLLIMMVAFLIISFGISNLVNFMKNIGKNPGKELDLRVGKAIMKAAHPDWRYEPESQLSALEISPTGLSSFVFGLNGSNLTTGKYGNTNFAFSLYKSPIAGGDEKSIQTKLVMIFDFHKDIKGRTVIFPDEAQKTLGTWLGKEVQKIGWKGLDLVYFEDPIFEKHFAVYGTDQIESRYILTPNMMQGLVKLREKYDHDFTYSFASGKVCVVISGLPDYRNQLDTQIIPDGAFYHFYRPVELAIDVIETMNLNTRIWSKE